MPIQLAVAASRSRGHYHTATGLDELASGLAKPKGLLLLLLAAAGRWLPLALWAEPRPCYRQLHQATGAHRGPGIPSSLGSGPFTESCPPYSHGFMQTGEFAAL